MLITLDRSSFRYIAIGDQSLKNSSRVPLNTYDSLSNGKMDINFSYHVRILGGSLFSQFCNIMSRAAHNSKNVSVLAFIISI